MFQYIKQQKVICNLQEKNKYQQHQKKKQTQKTKTTSKNEEKYKTQHSHLKYIVTSLIRIIDNQSFCKQQDTHDISFIS